MLEIDKILTVSSSHISRESYEWLTDQCEKPTCNIMVAYEKDEYGFILYICKHFHLEAEKSDIPDDIYKLIKLAIEHDCTYLCLDVDGQPVPGIMTYENAYD